MSTTADTSRARGRIRIEPSAKRVRAYLGGEVVVDTTRPLLVWEGPYYPTYYFPADDVRTDMLEADGGVAPSPSRGEGRTFTVCAGGREAAGAAVRYENSPIPELNGLIRLEWSAMDAWFEEDEEVFTHPRDPYTRVDILPSYTPRPSGGRRRDGRRVGQPHVPVRDQRARPALPAQAARAP
jgi:uncharacterized protein (DUF427 family)